MKNNINLSELKREIGLTTASAVVVANMVGTGIFTTSGFIVKELGDFRLMLLCWLVGGLFALFGALAYGELGARFPAAGGEYVYLRETYGRWMGFLSGWISLVVGFSAPIAAAAIAFAAYGFQALSIPAGRPVVLSISGVNIFTLSPEILVAVAVIVALSLVHYHSLRVGSRVQNALTGFKVALILGFVIAGLLSDRGSIVHLSGGLDLGALLQERFAVSLIFVSFAYSGWNAAAYLGGEIQRPGRNIPLALAAGTALVILLYLLLNIVYSYALRVDEMSGVIEVAAKAAISLFGAGAGRYISGAIAVGLLSVLSAMIMTGPRVYYAMSKDGLFFELFARVSRARRTPGHSISLQAAIAVIMVITASFEKLLIYIGFTLSLFAMLTVLGVIILRIRRPDPDPRYRTFGYPATPTLFILGNLWIIYFSLKSRPGASLAGLATIGLGLLVYLYFGRKLKQREET